jgi:hypothetical protein
LPINGAFLQTRRPAISAKFADVGSGVDVASVQMSLDDVDVTSQAQVSAAGFSFTPGSDLAEQVHILAIAIKEAMKREFLLRI